MEGIIFIVVLRVHFLVGDPPTLVFLFFLLHHWFVATTAVTRPMRVEKGQKAPSSSGRTADSDASDDGEESSSASKFKCWGGIRACVVGIIHNMHGRRVMEAENSITLTNYSIINLFIALGWSSEYDYDLVMNILTRIVNT